MNGTVVRSAEEKTAEYAVFALVPIFCVMGLLGILICNILKKKGYRCTADKEGGDEETATPQKEGKKKAENERREVQIRKGSVITETSIYTQVVVTFAHKNATRTHEMWLSVVRSQGRAKPTGQCLCAATVHVSV